MSDQRQKNELVLAFTEEGRSEAPKASQEGTESRTAKCETERPASHEQWMEEVCERENCWRYDWVVDLDIKGFFDNLDQNLLMRAVKKHAKHQWLVLYIERWLKAPVQEEDGKLIPREKGTPQGGVISPLLVNLFLHYAFDRRWITVKYPHVPFERYADDAIVHCKTETEAQEVRAALATRLGECGLELHPEKTRIVYCKDDERRRRYPNEKFDFLGYTFQARRSKNRKGKFFINFSPAVSNKAAMAMGTEVRSWNLPQRSGMAIEDLSRMFNPIVRGWIRYYGRYYPSALYPTMRQLDRDLAFERAQFYNSLALRVLGRPVRHTALLHHSALNAMFLGDLIGMFVARGWNSIDAKWAYTDPVYDRQPNILPAGESLVWALAKETGKFDKELRYPGEDDVYENRKMDALKI